MVYQTDYLYDPKSRNWLLTVKEAARRLHISERTVYRMLHCGELSRIRVRGCTRVLGSEVADLLSSTEYGDANLVGPPTATWQSDLKLASHESYQ